MKCQNYMMNGCFSYLIVRTRIWPDNSYEKKMTKFRAEIFTNENQTNLRHSLFRRQHFRITANRVDKVSLLRRFEQWIPEYCTLLKNLKQHHMQLHRRVLCRESPITYHSKFRLPIFWYNISYFLPFFESLSILVRKILMQLRSAMI